MSRKQRAVVVMYHGFTPGGWGAHSPEALRWHLELFAAEREVIPLLELARRLRHGEPTDRALALTFDDAYADFATTAYPLLINLQLAATLFVPTAYIGGLNVWDRGRVPPAAVLGLADLQRLDPAYVSIGSHTATHRALIGLDDAEEAEELIGSKRALEAMLQRPILEFSYPYGHRATFDARRRAAVRAAGYEVAVTSRWGTSASSNDIHSLPRVHFSAADDQRAIRATLSGRRDWIAARERLGALLHAQ